MIAITGRLNAMRSRISLIGIMCLETARKRGIGVEFNWKGLFHACLGGKIEFWPRLENIPAEKCMLAPKHASGKHAQGTAHSLVWQEGLKQILFLSISVFPRLYHLIPDGEITSIKINRVDPNESLSIRLVGGSETPLVHIIIQHIYRDGVIARDGRLLPGDIILKVPRRHDRVTRSYKIMSCRL